MKLRFFPIFGALLTGLLVFFVALNMKESRRDVQDLGRQNNIQRLLESKAATLSKSVNAHLLHVRSLSAFVSLKKDFTRKEFDDFSLSLQEGLSGLRSLQLAPDGIVTYISNLESNRAALGHDLFGDESRRRLAEKSKSERTFIIAGPVDLIQGGQAIIARKPIFIKNADANGDYFWGFATVLIDFESLIKHAGIYASGSEYNYAIRGKDGLGANGDVFFGNETSFSTATAIANVRLPNGSWQIGAWNRKKHNYKGFFFSDYYGVSLAAIIILFGSTVYLILAEPSRLREAVRRSTNELRVAKEEAENANNAKTDFMSTMNHELRTPLTSIRGALGLVHAGIFDDKPGEKEKAVSMALRNCNRLASLIDDSLDFFKIGAGRMEYHMASVDVAEFVQTAHETNKGFGDAYRVNIVVKGDVPEGKIKGDESRLQQVFSNLLSNAVKYSKTETAVNIVVTKMEETIRFEVQDTGPGIQKEHRSRIFDEFTTIDSSDKRRVGGTGLGLFISKAIIEEHDGVLSVKDRESGGSIFYFELPLEAAQIQNAETAQG